MLNRLIWLSRRPAILAAPLVLAACAHSPGSDWSRTIEPELPIEGTYQWLDAHELETGCLVQIFRQNDEYRGMVKDDPYQPRDCPWYGYELYEFEVRGFEVRMILHDPYRSSPHGSPGTASYLLNLRPHVSLKGRLIRRSGGFRADPRWIEMTLVYLR
jgi:hypothetical protein